MARILFLPACIIIAILAGATIAVSDTCTACGLVVHYGENIGGPETVGSLIVLNMRDWKPQSSRGIEIYGWRSESTGPFTKKISYSYREHGGDLIELAWQVDLRTEEALPINFLSRQIMRMACIF